MVFALPILRNNPLIATIYQLASKYPTPINLNYFWNFGVFALITLLIQIITGLILVCIIRQMLI